MIEIDGEFFETPIEELKKEKNIKMLSLVMEISAKLAQLQCLKSQPILPSKFKFSGEVVNIPNGENIIPVNIDEKVLTKEEYKNEMS